MMRRYFSILGVTLFICWFVFLIQMLWLYTDELVGKGLDLWIIGKLIFNAALIVLPTSVPLWILLASLMTFGSLGEKLELLAMKSAGVPLHKLMLSLLGIVLSISFSLFVYLNTIVMDAQVRFFQIIFSARESRPDLDIPEGVFYNGLKGYNIFVKKKDSKTQSLQDVLIYDHSSSRTPRVIRSKTGRLILDSTKSFLVLDLFNGESFEAFEDKNFLSSRSVKNDSIPPGYLKEKFGNKKIVVFLDNKFSMIDAGGLRSQFVGKNIFQLDRYIRDTAMVALDSVGIANGDYALKKSYEDRYLFRLPSPQDTSAVSMRKWEAINTASRYYPIEKIPSLDSLTLKEKERVLRAVSDQIESMIQSTEYHDQVYDRQAYYYRTHAQEWHRKLTFPFACILFFFIGAPLGAIIRKGGLGVPIVTSILFFVLYYMLDTFGYNLSYNGTWVPWFGMWFSTICLIPFAIYLTFQSSRDSSSLNLEAVGQSIKRFFVKEKERYIVFRELVVHPLKKEDVSLLIKECRLGLLELQESKEFNNKTLSFSSFLVLDRLYKREYQSLEQFVFKLQDSKDKLLVAKLMDIPFLEKEYLSFLTKRKLHYWGFILLFPLFLLCLLLASKRKSREKKKIASILKIFDEMGEMIEKELVEENKNRDE